MNIKEVKKLNKEYPANLSRKTVEMIEFEEAEAKKLELVKRHIGPKQNREVGGARTKIPCSRSISTRYTTTKL